MKRPNLIFDELRAHAPFTALGSLAGLALLLGLLRAGLPAATSAHVFHVLHPLHVLMSAQATMASYCPLRASDCASSGISNAPGTLKC